MQILGNVIKRQVAGAVLRTVVQQFFTIIFQKESVCGGWEAVWVARMELASRYRAATTWFRPSRLAGSLPLPPYFGFPKTPFPYQFQSFWTHVLGFSFGSKVLRPPGWLRPMARPGQAGWRQVDGTGRSAALCQDTRECRAVLWGRSWRALLAGGGSRQAGWHHGGGGPECERSGLGQVWRGGGDRLRKGKLWEPGIPWGES